MVPYYGCISFGLSSSDPSAASVLCVRIGDHRVPLTRAYVAAVTLCYSLTALAPQTQQPASG